MAVRNHQTVMSWICAILGMGFLNQMAGCSNGETLPDTYPVSGTVLHNSKPVEGATVVFRSSDSETAQVATGVTDAQGGFELSTFGDKDGAVAGSHVVTVTKMSGAGRESKSLSMEEAAKQENVSVPQAKHELPQRYSDPNQSGLVADVKTDGSSDIKLELTD